ncbi:TonB-dependent receptor [Mucilaginibacter dorajii]|nr:TonB-dependent receptor [Mucilaginibacter dorajii]MCS3732301.1 TonB-linked SusC/RagA family outer membrane protein [Mucilaginibacter dorajii]
MKLTAVFMITAFLQVSARSFSQQVTVHEKNISIEKVLKLIKKQSSYHFLYKIDELSSANNVDLDFTNASIESVLDKCFKNTPFTYKIVNRTILVKKNPDATASISTSTIVLQKVEGVVTDEKGIPLPGVTVKLKGTGSGAVTDLNGKFTIDVPNANGILIFSMIGFTTQEVTVSAKQMLNIRLKEAPKDLSEVVVVGYGTQKKVNLTGAVGNVRMDDMETRPITSASLALQGTVAGVFALQNSGKPGGDDATINIRGVGTLNNSNPLVLIDGFPGNMSDVSANDIQSISVLKDAASAAIYGNRAANGVILITTKRGTTGKMTVTYNGYGGVQSATSLPKMLNSTEWVTLYNEALANQGSAPKYTPQDIQKYAAHNDPMYPDVDYFGVYYGKAQIQNHRINILGGTENLKYAFMLGHLNQDGILINTNYKKTDFRSNIDAFFLKDKKLRFSARISGNAGKMNEPTDLFYVERSSTIAPIWPLKNAAGQWVAVIGETNYYGQTKEGSTRVNNRYTANTQFEAEYQFLNGFSAQLTYGYNVATQDVNAFHANVTLANTDGSTRNLTSDLTETNNLDTQTLLTSLLKYQKKLGKSEFNLLGGYSEESFNWKWNSGFRSKFINNTQRILNLGDPSTQQNNAANYALGLRSLFGRINYIYGSKYLFEANIRRDGSSRFANDQRWGTFPSLSAGWIISEESFMKNVSWLNMLKLRGSWGRLGNQNINSYYAASDFLTVGENYSLGGSLYPGVATTSLSNKKTTWETSEQTDIGIDMSIANSIDLTFDYFNKKTSNILMQIPVPVTLGNLVAPYQNVGAVNNKGLEMTATYRKTFSNGLKFSSTISLSHIVNKITDLHGRSPIINGSTALVEGSAINSFYGYKTDGIYQVNDFTWQNNSDPSIPQASRTYVLKPGVVSVSNFNATPGDIKYKDLNGDGLVTMDKDRTVIGKQYPDLSYSLQLHADWKQFDLGVFFQGVQGIQGYTGWNISTATNIPNWWLGRWTPESPSNTLPKMSLDAGRTGVSSEFYMGNASYLRLKNVELGYTFNKGKLLGISSVRIYGNVQNAFTITKFKGLDPEQIVGQTGVEAYPQVRILTAGLIANF